MLRMEIDADEGDAVTEQEWLTCQQPIAMLHNLPGTQSDRKMRMLVCLLARRQREVMTDDAYKRVVEAAERYAEGFSSEQEREDEYQEIQTRLQELISQQEFERAAFLRDARRLLEPRGKSWSSFLFHHRHWLLQTTELIHDIYGNPFQPVTVDLCWRSETVVALATGIYAERAFDRLPILADALEEAGCNNLDLLSHCRGPRPHVRGCWVVDLLLGKE